MFCAWNESHFEATNRVKRDKLFLSRKPRIKQKQRNMKVLLPIDWSENSQKAFDWYLSCLYQPGTIIILVHWLGASNDREMHEKEVKLMNLQETYETKLLQRKVDYRWVTGSEGNPGELIIKVAAEEDVQLIVMGSRGLGKLKKVILGSVSDYVLNKTDIPVLICKRGI